MKRTLLLYMCPKCKKDQEVELNLLVEDKNTYRFTTICSDCGQKLVVKICFDVGVKSM